MQCVKWYEEWKMFSKNIKKCTRWEPRQARKAEGCLELVDPQKSEGNWNDADCHQKRYPICQIPPV